MRELLLRQSTNQVRGRIGPTKAPLNTIPRTKKGLHNHQWKRVRRRPPSPFKCQGNVGKGLGVVAVHVGRPSEANRVVWDLQPVHWCCWQVPKRLTSKFGEHVVIYSAGAGNDYTRGSVMRRDVFPQVVFRYGANIFFGAKDGSPQARSLKCRPMKVIENYFFMLRVTPHAPEKV